ncbi:MAG: DUF6544 family protein [Jatrophihabitans sp.]
MIGTINPQNAEREAASLAGPIAAGEVRALWRRLTPTDPDTVDPVAIDTLPEPAQRWLRHSLTQGAPMARAVVLRITGRIRIGRWLPFRAIQLHAPPHGYLWVAQAGCGPMSVRGYDGYADGRGVMRWRLFGRIPVLTAAGPDVDRSAAGRVALDAFTVPAAWLDPAVRWSAGSDGDSAMADWIVDGHRMRPEIRVDPNGALRSVSMPRWAAPDHHPWAEYPCGGLLSDDVKFGGTVLPSVARAGYFPGTDQWGSGEFFRATITDAQFLC